LEYKGAGKLAPAPVTSCANDRTGKATVAAVNALIKENLKLNFMKSPHGLITNIRDFKKLL
jgi:hypothetical protein